MKIFKSLVVLSALAMALSATAQTKEPVKPVAPATEVAATDSTSKATPMDINTASASELATLPKIGEARAAAIVKGRPYKAKDELLQKKILPSDAYASVKDMIIAKQAPKKK